MNFVESRMVQVLLCGGALLVSASALGQAAAAVPSTVSSAAESYPQIVRIRAVEGDVRIARTNAKGQAAKAWEQAVDDLPLQTGFNLVTGDGRAEIEFEDASTLYLDKNSALSFDDLHTTDGVPHTEVSLLTGTCTAHLRPAFADEMFVVRTPTDRIRVVYPNKVYERITAYLDAVAITKLQEPGAKGQTVAAVTVFHNNGKVVPPAGQDDPAAFADWDVWVASRVQAHAEALKDVAEISGLLDSTPGLADIKDEGVFFPCAPYGTCWEPTAEDDGQVAAPSAVGQGPEFQPKLSPSAVGIYAGDAVKTKVSAVGLQGFADPVSFSAQLPQGFSCINVCEGQLLPGETFVLRLASAPDVPVGTYQVAVTLSSGPLTHVVILKVYVGLVGDDDFVPVALDAGGSIFPCGPGGVPPLPSRTPRGFGGYGGAPRYAWGVCHTGSWIYRQHRYIWVIDKRGHDPHDPHDPHHPHHPHHPFPPHPDPPIRWIKWKHEQIWVPRHPDDVDGKLPLNWKHVAFRPVDTKDGKTDVVKLDAKAVAEPLAETPKEFVDPPEFGLVSVGAPTIQAYETKDRLAGSKLAGGSELRFDRGTHSFLLTHEVKDGGKTRVVTESFEQHRVSTRGGVAGSGGAHSAAVAHAGGASHSSGGGGSHAAAGGSHAAASHASSGGSHASAPASHPAAAAAPHH